MIHTVVPQAGTVQPGPAAGIHHTVAYSRGQQISGTEEDLSEGYDEGVEQAGFLVDG
jgi:hypothetical protein